MIETASTLAETVRMRFSIGMADAINSVFEATCLIPAAFSLVALVKAENTEALSMTATVWWWFYLMWATLYLWRLDQPISMFANAVICIIYGAEMVILFARRAKNSDPKNNQVVARQ